MQSLVPNTSTHTQTGIPTPTATPFREFSYRRQVANNAHTLHSSLSDPLGRAPHILWGPMGQSSTVDYTVSLAVLDDHGVFGRRCTIQMCMFDNWPEARYHLTRVLKHLGITRYQIEQQEQFALFGADA